jgi:hypothetical protein
MRGTFFDADTEGSYECSARTIFVLEFYSIILVVILSHYQHVFNRELIYYFSSYSGLMR